MELLKDDTSGLSRAVEILRLGGIGAYPTDTVYGLGARIDLEDAIKRVFQAKGRGYSQPLPVLIADMAQVDCVAAEFPAEARRLAQRFWPGGLTLVLCKLPGVSSLVSAGVHTIAVRLPAHRIPVALVRGLNVPIAGTSANISGQAAPVTAGGAITQLGDKIDFVIDGGRCPGGKESTIVDVTHSPPRLLREGAILGEEIARVLGSPLDSSLPAAKRPKFNRR